MKLCSTCDKFALHDFASLPDRTYTFRLQTLEAGARWSCSLCTFFHAALQSSLIEFQCHPDVTWIRLQHHPDESRLEKTGGMNRHVGLQLHELELYLANTKYQTKIEQRSKGIFLGLAANTDSPAAQDGTIAGRYYGDEPGSDVHIASILEWLGACLKHVHCCQTASGANRLEAWDALLPTRCVEVSHRRIYLRETAGQRGSYITLSHRWNAETELCKTTRDNVEQRQAGRGFGSLPQKFQDVMTLVQRLGVRYVWIDSLCIIQDGDDAVDWAKEATQMGTYYQRSLLTISLISEEPSQDMWETRQKSPFQSLLRMPHKDIHQRHQGWFYIYQPIERSQTSFVADVRKSELLHRGWIFQEWFLSRRTIYCTPHQLFFECQTDLPCNERQQKFMVDSKSDVATRIRDRMRIDADFDVWYDVVEMYSRTSLTKPSKDHLVAISGIATEMRSILEATSKQQTQLHKQYVSGMWFEDLHHGLLWQTRARITKPCGCGAPSWSWLARSGEVRWLSRSTQAETATSVIALRDSWAQLHDADALKKWMDLESFARRGNTTVADLDAFGTTSVTTGIVMQAILGPVLVKKLSLPTTDPLIDMINLTTISTLARETDVSLDFIAKDRVDMREFYKDNADVLYAQEWLLICAPSTPDIIGGWALLDDADFQKRLMMSEGPVLLALHVSTRKKVGKLDKSKPYEVRQRTIARDVYEVLFVEPLEANRYRRVGVGRIFDDQILADLKTGSRIEIELV